ncbi:putative proline-rich receptor-like protein kinase PERK11 [Vitis vinifera]|uniref:Putative proline-rich receptor-like protein kinase PERK11 n=1 Tax=Vitis vinifera TaxID=29760 RepID=A0A438BTY7_VITVI|nr:putative proline-rich receptor-like protein kinase PERK11 [Vitis vinifera]
MQRVGRNMQRKEEGAQTTSFQDLKTTPLRNLPPGTENSRMELVGESEESGGGSGGDGRSVVVVGVKLDQRSKELLTWALVKVAQSGDRVVAVHVLTDAAAVTMTGGKSSLLSLFDTFKTLLAAYEGFCNLKQVELKLKRRATAKTTDYSREGPLALWENTLIRSFLSCSPYSVLPEKDCSQVMEELSDEDESIEDNSFALVPIEPMESVSCSNSVVVDDFPELKPVRLSLRRIFLRNRQSSEKSSLRKMPLSQWVLRLPSCHNSAVVYPDKKHSSSDSDQDEDHSANLDGEKGAILLLGSDAGFTPESPNGSAKSLPKELEGLHEKYSSTCRLFTYQELLLATSNFRPVKILKQSGDVLKEFVLEIEIITTLHHKNIISLFGFCFEDNNLLLVYDFLSRGSLEENLHGKKKDPMTFGWGERYRVALGVAEALDYLHNGCGQPVIHRDVKSSNILLSDDFEPQLSDFGLAAWANTASHKNCPDVAELLGVYLAPEYFMYGKVNDKIDVYAFGVVLLELLSGRKPISSEYPKGQESLVMWAKPILRSGKISKLLDPDLDSNYDDPQIERMFWLLHFASDVHLDFGLKLVLKLLLGDMEIIQWAKQQVSAMEGQEVEGESFPSNIQSHLNLALLDLEDDSLSISSTEQSISLEDYLQGRWSRSSSFA